MEAEKACPSCEGTGKRERFGTGQIIDCYECNGAGKFMAPNWSEIIGILFRTMKDGKKRWKAKAPNWRKMPDPLGPRCYFVWRMARFDGGKDVTLPVGASMTLGRDPYRDELEAFASMIAAAVFGSNKRGHARWHYALTGNVTEGFVDGPTYDEDKPAYEVLETK